MSRKILSIIEGQSGNIPTRERVQGYFFVLRYVRSNLFYPTGTSHLRLHTVSYLSILYKSPEPPSTRVPDYRTDLRPPVPETERETGVPEKNVERKSKETRAPSSTVGCDKSYWSVGRLWLIEEVQGWGLRDSFLRLPSLLVKTRVDVSDTHPVSQKIMFDLTTLMCPSSSHLSPLLSLTGLPQTRFRKGRKMIHCHPLILKTGSSKVSEIYSLVQTVFAILGTL